MDISGLKKYCDKALETYATHAKPIYPGTVVTAPWVRLKCQYGCGGYGKRYGCPPDTPTPELPTARHLSIAGSTTCSCDLGYLHSICLLQCEEE